MFEKDMDVTILILIDGFLQFSEEDFRLALKNGHNPYFNRWFSAIAFVTMIWHLHSCHNPYFNRWFSAINLYVPTPILSRRSQSLF